MTESRLPAPAQLLLVPMSEEEVAEMIERHIEFVDKTGRPVHLPMPFVRHYIKRNDGALSIATTISQLPIVLHNGDILQGPGLHRPSGVIFRVPKELTELMPTGVSDCDEQAVIAAMRFLTDNWLCDVAADYEGKYTIIACALTVIERALIPERPAFFIVAGRRGGGKTTTIHMISTAVLGIPACAAAWSNDPEERRKALLAYFSAGIPMLTWDNIVKGMTISCPHIERALTNEFYTDRVLGESQHRIVLTSTVHIFTGNNISPRGDMNSRSLTMRLAVERPDPENREFQHPDPLNWTEAHRGEILKALYTILLGILAATHTAKRRRTHRWRRGSRPGGISSARRSSTRRRCARSGAKVHTSSNSRTCSMTRKQTMRRVAHWRTHWRLWTGSGRSGGGLRPITWRQR